MPPTSDNPESVHRPGIPAQSFAPIVKPPLPTLPSSRSRNESSIEVQLPHVIAGALVAAFAAAVADGLGDVLLTHYYLSDDQRIRVNLDRVLDRLVANFTRHVWDELWDFYYATNPGHARQLSLLFEGPIRQIVLILNGPEPSRCILDRIGPGLSRRQVTWSETAGGIDLDLAVKLVCRYWHHEYASRSPGGNPDDIARSIRTHVLSGNAFSNFLARVRKVLCSPHYVQVHLMESAAWDIPAGRRKPPPADGFHIMQFRFECDPRTRIVEEGHVDIGSFPVIVGTAGNCLLTSVSPYVERHWPRCGRVVLRCLGEALSLAAKSSQQGQPFAGMSLWDHGDPGAALSPGLRLVHVEVEEGMVRLSVSAWVLALVEILPQMAWTCAALTSSPFPEGLSECSLQITGWDHLDESTFVNCSLAHRAVPTSEGASWLQQRRGAVVVTGFPIEEHTPPHLI